MTTTVMMTTRTLESTAGSMSPWEVSCSADPLKPDTAPGDSLFFLSFSQHPARRGEELPADKHGFSSVAIVLTEWVESEYDKRQHHDWGVIGC